MQGFQAYVKLPVSKDKSHFAAMNHDLATLDGAQPIVYCLLSIQQ